MSIEVLSHRGLWIDPAERNGEAAFLRSFGSGFGTETDLRDRDGDVVISHDPPTGARLSLARFFELYNTAGRGLPLALNIKSDGLQPRVAELIRQFQIENYFVFDMSVPDAVSYFVNGMCTYTRHSEYEPTPPFYDQAIGVWVDGFAPDWTTEEGVAVHVKAGKQVCIVSTELHGGAPERLWHDIRSWRVLDKLRLCTDRPAEAREFFGG